MKEEFIIQIDALTAKLEEFRARNGLSVRELAKLTGCSINTIQKIRRKDKSVTPRSIKKIYNLIQEPPHRPIPWNVPFRPNPYFVGRRREMQVLKEMLHQGFSAVISQVSQISGMGGVGKTQLAVEYAHTYKSEYPGGVLWVRGCQDILSEYGSLGQILGLELPMKMDESEKCWKVKECLQQRQENTLLVLDNLDDVRSYENIRQYLPTTGSCQILITTRRKDLDVGASLSLDILTDEEALYLLTTESGRESEGKEVTQNICRALGNLPLALEVAGKYLNKMTVIAFKEYYDKLMETGLTHRSLQGDKILPNTDHIASLKATLSINKELMSNPRIIRVFSTIVCFEPESINPEILFLVCGMDWEGNKEIVWELISVLDNYSLLQIQADNRLSLHRLMREVLKEQLPQNEIKAMQKAYVIQLQKWFREHNDVASLKTTTPELPHVVAATNLALESNIWPQSYELCIDLRAYYDFMGRYKQSLEWGQKSMAEVKVKAPADQIRLALSCNSIGSAWYCLGKYKKAISYAEQALDIWRKVYGEKHPQVATGLNDLGSAWRDLKEYKKAIGYFEQALSITREYYGQRHPNVARDLNSLGSTWYYLEKYKKAISCAEQALDIWRKVYGEKHPQVATGLNNLGGVWRDLREYEKAIGCFEQALSITRECYGQRHPDVARSLNGLGSVCYCLGEYDRAREYVQQAYSIFVEFLGNNHPITKIVKDNLEILTKKQLTKK